MLYSPELLRVAVTNVVRRPELAKQLSTAEANGVQVDPTQREIEQCLCEPFPTEFWNRVLQLRAATRGMVLSVRSSNIRSPAATDAWCVPSAKTSASEAGLSRSASRPRGALLIAAYSRALSRRTRSTQQLLATGHAGSQDCGDGVWSIPETSLHSRCPAKGVQCSQ